MAARGDRARDDVARRELVGEAVAVVVDEQRALAAQRLREQEAVVEQRGRVELDELEVGERGPGAIGEHEPLAERAGRVRRPLPERRVAAGREQRRGRGDGPWSVTMPTQRPSSTQSDAPSPVGDVDARVRPRRARRAPPRSPSRSRRRRRARRGASSGRLRGRGRRRTRRRARRARRCVRAPPPSARATALARQSPRPARQRVRGVERRGRRRRRSRRPRRPARSSCSTTATGPSRAASTSVSAGSGERRGEAGDAAADHDQAVRSYARVWRASAGFLLKVDNLATESTWFPTPERKQWPAQTVVAVVLQVRDGRLQVLLWERALEPFAGAWSPPGRRARERRDARAVDPPPPRREGRRPRARPPRAAGDAERPGPQPAALGARDRLSRARPERRRPRRYRTTRAGTRSTPARSSPSTTSRSCSPAATAFARSSRTRTSASRSRRATLHHLRAPGPLPRGARARRLGDEPPARAPAPPPARRHRRAPREPGRAGGRPAALYRFRTRALEITDQFAVLRPPAG